MINDGSTSYNSIAFPVFVTAQSSGKTCNLNCIYCSSKETNNSLYVTNGMPLPILEQFTIQYIDAQIHADVYFFWYGGEPLLRGIDFYREAVRMQQQYSNGKKIFNTLQTNGTLLDLEWCTFLKKNNFQLIVTLDGPEHCHNQYRKKSDGTGSFYETMRGVEYLKRFEIPFEIRATVNDYNVQYPLELYDFFKTNNLHQIEFTPLMNIEHGHISKYSVPPIAFGHFLCSIFDEWVRHDVGKMNINIIENALNVLCGNEPVSCTFSSTCGHKASIDVQGNLYSCNYYSSLENKLGNISQSTITGMMYGRKQLRFGQQKRVGLTMQCKKCAHLKLCNGGCIKHRVGISTSGEKHHNIFCQGYQQFYDHIIPAMKFLAEEITAGGNSARVMSYFEYF